MTSRPAAPDRPVGWTDVEEAMITNPKPEPETPETDAEYEANGHKIHVEVDDGNEVIEQAVDIDFARSLERRLSLAQTEIKWLTMQTTRLGKDLVCAQENFHVTNQAYVKADVERTQAQARIAELEKDAARLDAVQARKLTIGISRAGDFFVHADLSGDEATRCPNVRSAIDAALKDRA